MLALGWFGELLYNIHNKPMQFIPHPPPVISDYNNSKIKHKDDYYITAAEDLIIYR